MVVRIDLVWPRVCAVVLGVRTVSYLEPARKAIGNCCTPLRVACNVIRVATWFGYTLGVSYEGRGRVRQCRECEQATWSS